MSGQQDSSALQTLQQVQRVDFLFKAGHGMLFNVPSLSRYYMNEYHNTLLNYELTPHKGLNRVACKQCGQIRLPGFNTRVELVKYKNSKKRNRLLTTCTSCCRTMVYSGSNKKKIPARLKDAPAVEAAAAVKTQQPLPTAAAAATAPPPMTEKKKKNKGKKNSLKALLSKSNNNNQSNSSGGGGGGLGDFLSSL